MKYFSMQEFLFTMINLTEVELSVKKPKVRELQEQYLEKFGSFVETILLKFVDSFFELSGLVMYSLSHDTFCDLEMTNENIFRLFWNITNHILLSEDYSGIKQNIFVAKFLLSKKLYDSIKKNFDLSMNTYSALQGLEHSSNLKSGDFEFKRKFIDR